MQKAIEDAMQGVLISNDRNVRSISTEIMRQDTDVDFPHISIYAGPYGVQPPLAIYNGEGMMSWGNPQSDPMKDVIRTFKTHYTDGVF